MIPPTRYFLTIKPIMTVGMIAKITSAHIKDQLMSLEEEMAAISTGIVLDLYVWASDKAKRNST